MYLKIKVVPDASSETIEKKSEDTWRVRVKAPATNNAANNRVLELVRQAYPNKAVRVVSGHHSPSKIFSIED